MGETREVGREIDTGDSVKHGSTGETWVVAYVEGDWLAWIGWPEGEARLADCTLVEKADATERLRILRMMSEAPKSDRRARYALAALATLTDPHS